MLMALASQDGQSQRQLSARLGIHRNAMVTVIDALEADGLVKRMAHPDDRRAFAITLTDHARKLLPDLDKAGRGSKIRSPRRFRPPNETPCTNCCSESPVALAGGAGLIPGVHPALARGAMGC